MSEILPAVHLVDDDASSLTAVSRLLRASGFTVKPFASAEDFLASLREDTAGCLVVDLHMPKMNGLELQTALVAAGCAMPVIFLTGQGDIPSTVRAIRGGAEDYLEKRGPKEELLAAIGRALERDARGRSEQAQLREIQARLDLLTDREREVLGHVVLGKLNKQIASDLGIHERTVKLHRTAITTKLKVPSVAELTLLAHRVGILPNAGSE